VQKLCQVVLLFRSPSLKSKVLGFFDETSRHFGVINKSYLGWLVLVSAEICSICHSFDGDRSLTSCMPHQIFGNKPCHQSSISFHKEKHPTILEENVMSAVILYSWFLFYVAPSRHPIHVQSGRNRFGFINCCQYVIVGYAISSFSFKDSLFFPANLALKSSSALFREHQTTPSLIIPHSSMCRPISISLDQ